MRIRCALYSCDGFVNRTDSSSKTDPATRFANSTTSATINSASPSSRRLRWKCVLWKTRNEMKMKAAPYVSHVATY